MSSTNSPEHPFHVLVVGGGVAALEAGLALRELGSDRFRITLLAPNADFVYRPLTVREPFAYAPARRYPIVEFAAEIGAELRVERLARLDPAAGVAHTVSGSAIDYDAAILGLGANPQARYEHALTVDDSRLDELLHGLVQDVEGGYVHALAFVVPPRMAWPLPIYELALMTARRAYDMNVELAVTIVTPERSPLEIFGEGASAALAGLLAENGITTIVSASCEVPDSRRLIVEPGGRELAVDRVIALPELYGPSVPGLPADAHGFIPIDPHSRVRGVEHVYAAGDGTDGPLKYGGIAAQQSDAAVQAICVAAGLPVEAAPLHAVIHATLLTGAAPLYLTTRVIDGQGFSSASIDEPAEPPPAKIAARYLAPYLATRDDAVRPDHADLVSR
jgi:sulfide:quinone oxidoreductase